VRGRPDRSGAWAGAWLVVYASLATACWATLLLVRAVLHVVADLGDRWSTVQDLEGGTTEAQRGFAEVVGRIPELTGADAVPLLVAGAALALCLGAAGIGVLCRSGIARRAAAGLVAAMSLLVVGYTAVLVFVVHPGRIRWIDDLRQATADLRTSGQNVPPELGSLTARDALAWLVLEAALQAFHLMLLALLAWGVMRRGTRRWCHGDRAAIPPSA